MDHFAVTKLSSARQQLADYLRESILSGVFPVGYKFASSQDLARKWQIAESSVNAAMTVLVKEGLLKRIRKRGTFVTDREKKVTHIGVYLSQDVWRIPEAAYRRTMVSMVGEELRRRGITADIWVDHRPTEERKTPWPELVRVTDQRKIQGLLVLSGESKEIMPWPYRLAVPALTTHPRGAKVVIEPGYGADLAVEELARMGCRSVGMISIANPDPRMPDGRENPYAVAQQEFRRRAEELGLAVHDQWLPHPLRFTSTTGYTVAESDSEQFGYQAMKQLLAMSNRPDGIYACHDIVARGALTAVLESRVSVPDELKLVLFRNREIRWLCPLAVSYIELCVEEVAKALVNALLAQLRGEECAARAFKGHIVPAQCAPTSEKSVAGAVSAAK